jgi:dTDP-4-amino-4,6-dideoxygalactose transaminase
MSTTTSFDVPYTDLAAQAGTIKPELLRAVEGVLDSGRFILGPNVSAVEEEFAALCEAPIGLGVANGTDALLLILRALDLPAGAEVITAPNSFIASAAAIVLTGSTPILADVGDDLNLDPEAVEAAITPRTRALLPVHLTGRPARMQELQAIADEHDLLLIEDAAQSVGARLRGAAVGSLGVAACFSLHPLKNLHAYGDGGMITTGDEKLAAAVRKSRNHGLVDRDTSERWGYNSRLDEVHAAMLRVQLQHFAAWTQERRRLAARYNEALRSVVQVPDEAPDEYCVYQTYVIQTDRRDELQGFLRANGIEALVHYPRPIHLQPAASELGYGPEDLPNATRAADRIMSLPLYPGLSDESQDRVAELVRAFFAD